MKKDKQIQEKLDSLIIRVFELEEENNELRKFIASLNSVVSNEKPD